MAYGRKMNSLKDLKKSMAKGGAGGAAWIKYIPKNGSKNVRFFEEPEQWVNYTEHFDTMLRKSYPCSGESSCPGCAGGERKSSRYLANAIDLDDNNRVIPLQMPKDLANRLVVRYEKNGTLTDRDYELSRSGEGLDTTYDLDPSVPNRMNMSQYAPLDLLQTLEDAYNDVFGDSDEDEDDDEPELKAKVTKGRAKSAAAKTQPVDEDVDDEPEEVKPVKKAAAKKAAAKKAVTKAPEPEFDEPEIDTEDDEDVADDSPDVDEDADTEEDGTEEEAWDEESLKALPFGALRAVAREFGVSTKGLDADEIVDAILESGEEVDPEAPPY